MTFNTAIYIEALAWFGIGEIEGDKLANPTILKWIKWALPWNNLDDGRVAWCGIFMGVIFKNIGLRNAIPKTFYRARSWLDVGEEIDIKDAKQGDVMIFWRGSRNGWKGHVTLYTGEEFPKGYLCLGGNQSDKVGWGIYKQDRLLGIRRFSTVFPSGIDDVNLFGKLLLRLERQAR